MPIATKVEYTPGHYLEDFVSWVQRANQAAPLSAGATWMRAAEPWATRLLKAPRFLLPDQGYAIPVDEVEVNTPIRLPYPDTVLEFSFAHLGVRFRSIILASEFRDPDIGALAIRVQEFSSGIRGTWNAYHNVCDLLCDRYPFTSDHKAAYSRQTDILTGAVLTAGQVRQENARRGYSYYSPDSPLVVLSLIGMLQCNNVGIATIPAPVKLNAKRLAHGRLPFVEYKILMLTTSKGESLGTTDSWGHRNSPRQHLRRGHIRRVSSATLTWIPQCLVGNPKKGLIVKDYQVSHA